MIPIFIGLFLVMILFSSIEVTINLYKDGSSNKSSIKVCLFFGLIKYKKNISTDNINKLKKDIYFKNTGENKINKLKLFSLYKYFDVAKYILSKISWKVLIWDTEVGFNDAAITGFIVGLINIINSNIFAYLKNKKYEFKKIYLNAKPNFDTNVINMAFNCIFSLRIGHIIIAGFKFLWKR